MIEHRTAGGALLATAAYRGTLVEPLSEVIGDLADLWRQTIEAYQTSLGQAGLHPPASLRQVVSSVTAFADPLTADANDAVWQPAERRWRTN